MMGAWTDGDASPRPLDEDGVGRLLELVAGEGTLLDAATLYRRTAGDPRRLLIHLLAALVDGPDAGVEGPARLESARGPVRSSGTMRREGDYWTVTYRDRTVLLRDTRGLGYLIPLLERPGRPIHVSDLVDGRRTGDIERVRLRVTKGIGIVLERLRACHAPLADHLAATVRRGYFCRYLPDPAHPVVWETA